MEVTLDDLRVAYRRTKLKRQNITFLQAVHSSELRLCLTRIAEQNLKKNEETGEPAPKRRAWRSPYVED